jgi:hypothetical protein
LYNVHCCPLLLPSPAYCWPLAMLAVVTTLWMYAGLMHCRNYIGSRGTSFAKQKTRCVAHVSSVQTRGFNSNWFAHHSMPCQVMPRPVAQQLSLHQLLAAGRVTAPTSSSRQYTDSTASAADE